MSFSRSTSKRFIDNVSCAPPVGCYDVTKANSKSTGPVTFEKGGRFVENKEQTPGPADLQPSFDVNKLDVSHTSSIGNCSFATPSKPVRRNTKLKSSSNTDLSCKDLMSQQIHHLQYKIGELEKNLQRTLKDKKEIESHMKVICKDKEELVVKLEELQSEGSASCVQLESALDHCQNKILSLKQESIELDCQKKNLEADLKLGNQNVLALRGQVSNLETQKSEFLAQISELESTVWQLQVLLDQVRIEKRLCEEQILSVQADCKETRTTLSKIQRLHEDDKKTLTGVKRDLEEQKSQNEATTLNLREHEQKLELLSKERDSLKENVFNLQRAHELLQNRRDEMAAQLSEVQNAKADLEEEMELLENSTTENLRRITLKYESLEESYDALKGEFSVRESLLTSELDVTKASYESLKEDLQTMKNTYNSLHLNYDRMLAEANDLEEKLKESEETQKLLKDEKDKALEEAVVAHDAEKNALVLQVNELSKLLEENSNNSKKYENEISGLKSTIEGLELERNTLSRTIDEMKSEIETKDVEVEQIKGQFKNVVSTRDLTISKVKEELGKRIVETQAKMASVEHSFLRKLQLEQSKYAKLLSEHESLRSKTSADALHQDSEMWRAKYEDLESKTRPFQAQLELFEQEKRMLLSENDFKESEMTKLAENYARILGHQNNKQKIHHIIRIKEENLSLKKEVSRLRAQVSREKLAKKANSPNISRKAKFDPSKAFQHAGKENSAPKPLGELNESNLNSTVSW
ncbi:hyaluronan-mediated motility receptor-like [Rhopilema esculentum]|uniref:hyaluronan-mediated motility receptor-like n=1 Tax=Rhopilema esculentum TaxID=499914 RepID=UPI0031D66FB7